MIAARLGTLISLPLGLISTTLPSGTTGSEL